tara:strand:+ start:1162 stop:1374 length:213 start_codon:yes stop_codon:yes gene_type:complete
MVITCFCKSNQGKTIFLSLCRIFQFLEIKAIEKSIYGELRAIGWPYFGFDSAIFIIGSEPQGDVSNRIND